ncbi:MAG: hypothetical protein HY675_04025 [Chloroflexi bacterium]|nr:hypothetical protein [Chloroflexota bacterium]
MKKLFRVFLGTFLVALSISLTSGSAFAHESRALGKYQLAVGFIVEPAFEGQKNGVDLRVTNTQAGTATPMPVEGLEKTLRVEVAHVASGVSKVFNLRTIFRDPGHYTADLLLTAPGHYRMRFFGAIEGTNVNETFNSRSGGGNFNDVESSADIQFPTRVAEIREVEAVARHVEEENHDLEEKASRANTLATIGIVLGAIGTAGAAALFLTSRRKSK